MLSLKKHGQKGFTRANSKRSLGGFTVIELLVATTVFSIVLIVFLSAFLRISQLFYKGVNMARTQEAARGVMQSISDDIQFFQQTPTIGANYFCVGIHRYVVNPGVQVGSGPGQRGITREVIGSGCPSPAVVAVNSDNATELLDVGMQANNLALVCLNGQCTITIKIVFYGADNSVLVSPSGASPAYQAADARCSGPPSSSQYCATADYKATILQSF